MPCTGHKLDSRDIVAHRHYRIAVDRESSMAAMCQQLLIVRNFSLFLSSAHIVSYVRRVYFQPRCAVYRASTIFQ